MICRPGIAGFNPRRCPMQDKTNGLLGIAAQT